MIWIKVMKAEITRVKSACIFGSDVGAPFLAYISEKRQVNVLSHMWKIQTVHYLTYRR